MRLGVHTALAEDLSSIAAPTSGDFQLPEASLQGM